MCNHLPVRRLVIDVPVLLLVACQVLSAEAEGSVVYWQVSSPASPAGSVIQRVRVGSNNVETVEETGVGGFNSLALDIVNEKLYWFESQIPRPSGNVIRRASLDGANPEDVVTGVPTMYLTGIAVDYVHGKLYWSDGRGGELYTARTISRANLDGSEPEDLLIGLINPQLLAIDMANDYLYWAEANNIKRSDLDGSGIVDVMTFGDSAVSDVAFDPGNQTVYWADSRDRSIVRFDGTTEERILLTEGTGGLALDVDEGKIYFGVNGKVQRANLDGSQIEDVATGFPGGGPGPPVPRALAIDPTRPDLQAGDANQDLAFDVLDILQVQIAAKYLSGQPATWSQGDWDGAPGGNPGNPPVGDGAFNQLDIIAALAPSHYLTGPYAAIQPNGKQGDNQTSIGYDARTGEVWVDSQAGIELTSINIDSASGIFTGDPAMSLGGSFDNDADNNIFKATFGSSFGSISFGNVAQPGLAEDFLLNDVTAVGSLAGGGDLGEVDVIYIPIPEPSTFALALMAAVGLDAFVRRHRRNSVGGTRRSGSMGESTWSNHRSGRVQRC